MLGIHLSRKARTLGGLTLVAALIAAWALRPKYIDVDTAVVRRGAMRETVNEEGRTRVRDRFMITAPVSGRVDRIMLEEGDVVTPGRVVARIAPMPLDEPSRQQALARLTLAQALEREAASHVDDARQSEENARQALARRERVYAAGGISEEEHDAAMLTHKSRANDRVAAESRLGASSAEVRIARATLLALGGGGGARVPIPSPVRGSVLRIPEHSERIVAAGAPLVELGDASRIEVVVDLLSSDAVRVRAGDAVDVVDWGGSGTLCGHVRAIEPSAFTKVSALGVDEQRVNAVIDLDAPPPTLRDGFRVEAQIVVWQSPSVVIAPSSALFQHDSGWAVFLMNGNRAALRRVVIRHRTSKDVEVMEGLGPGDAVVVFPSDRVRQGVRIRARASSR
jgi:HlyD family secretion protein